MEGGRIFLKTLIIAACLLMVFIPAAYGQWTGYPALATLYEPATGTNIVLAESFDRNDFSYDEAVAVSARLFGAFGLIGAGAIVNVLTPADLNALGISDFASLDDIVYHAYKAAGFSLYLLLDIYMVPGYQPYGDGRSIAIDIWAADLAPQLQVPGNDAYLGSLQIPDTYLFPPGPLEPVISREIAGGKRN